MCAAGKDRKTQYVCVKCQAFVCMELFVPIGLHCCIVADEAESEIILNPISILQVEKPTSKLH